MKGLTTEELLKIRKTNIKIKCKKCGTEKSVLKFAGKASAFNSKFYLNTTCNHCLYLKKLGQFKEKLSYYVQKQKYREEFTIEGRACMLRNRCKQRAKISKLEFDLSIKLIKNKLSLGICEVTKIPLNFSSEKYDPYAPSIDRIDSSKGYIDSNIQITCTIYNFCKNQFSSSQVEDFFNNIQKYGGK